MIGRKK